MRRTAIVAASVIAAVGFIALGSWQVERRAWKHALVAQVAERVHAAPVAPPAPAQWPQVSAASDAYRPVRVAGRFLPGRSTRVQAVTERGGGFWVMAPLQTDDGIVLVNRGFVEGPAGETCEPTGPVVAVGLLRVSEPGGGFLRRNDPAADRWYSRDVAAIAAARGLVPPVAPFFIDAAAWTTDHPSPNEAACPVGGLTVIAFADNHLVYAVTWFALAGMSLFAAWRAFTLDRAGRARDTGRPDV